jgi:putative ATP-binding cassette transporter
MLLILELLTIGRWKLVQLTVLSLAAGLTNTGLLYLIGDSVKSSAIPRWVAVALFIGMLAVFYIAQRILLTTLVRQSERALRDIRLTLSRQLLLVRYASFERIGRAQILAALTHDAGALSYFWPQFVSLCVSSVTIVFSLIYLAFLSPYGFLLTAATIAVGVLIYLYLTHSARRQLKAARRHHDVFLAHVDDLISGMKELKLNKDRRHEIFALRLSETCERFFREISAAKIAHNDAGLIGNCIFLVLVGFVTYGMPLLTGLGASRHLAFLVVLLYLADPLVRIITNLPLISSAHVSAQLIRDLGAQLHNDREPFCAFTAHEPDAALDPQWRELRLVNVRYDYASPIDGWQFSLGPISLTIPRGQVLFVVGGNGAGKSTLGRLLTGLYSPTSGSIYLDDEPITPRNLDAYRQQFAAVFSDYHLFQGIPAIPAAKRAALAPLMREYALDEDLLTAVGRARIPTLSQGKRKRLALVLTHLEDKAIYFLDEWAADQDPEFRAYFYVSILPALKRAGKTMIVATHDERYFHAADKVLRLESGFLYEASAPQHTASMS